MNIAGIVLAAGASTRLGQPKQLLPYGHATFVEHAVDRLLAAGCDPVITVLGAYRDETAAVLAGSQTTVIYNEGWSSGMGSSIARGVRSLVEEAHRFDGLLISLCDQPKIPLEHMSRLRCLFDAEECSIVATEYEDGHVGVPAVFGSQHWESLTSLSGDVGARSIIASAASRSVRLERSLSEDFDTPNDLCK
ncbi:MAG: nucleotidyltransferase family protein [Phycisphaerae bacterium]